MSRKRRRTFDDTLLAVGPQNASVLERKARVAASLARSYPEYRGVLYAIESEALCQAFRVLVGMTDILDARNIMDETRPRKLGKTLLVMD